MDWLGLIVLVFLWINSMHFPFWSFYFVRTFGLICRKDSLPNEPFSLIFLFDRIEWFFVNRYFFSWFLKDLGLDHSFRMKKRKRYLKKNSISQCWMIIINFIRNRVFKPIDNDDDVKKINKICKKKAKEFGVM